MQEVCYKRYFLIDQQIARHFMQYSDNLPNPLPFNANQITNLFLNSRTSTNHDKKWRF